MERRQEALALAEYSANALMQGDVAGAVRQALQAIPSGDGILEAPVTAEAQKALTDALGVYDLSEGFKAFGTIELPSAPFDIAVSPGGTRLAVVYAYAVAVFDLETGQELAVLATQESALADCVFVDEGRIIYAGEQGVTAYDLETQKELWTGGIATTLALSADKTTVAAVDRAEDFMTVYHTEDGAVATERSFEGLHRQVAANDIFADARNDIFALNGTGDLAAVSFSNGGLYIYDLNDPEGDMILYEESDYQRFSGGFYGKYFAFTAQKSGEAVFGMVDTQEAAYLGGNASQDGFILDADERGIYLARGNLLVRVDPAAMKEEELAYTENVNITGFAIGKEYVLAATDDNGFAFYDSGANLFMSETGKENCDFVVLTDRFAVTGNRSETRLRVLRLEAHDEAQLLRYDARYQHNEARISQDGQTAMLFDYKGFCIYGLDGTLLAEEELPDAGEIYDQQFRKEDTGSYLEVTWYDGTVRCYSAENGELFSEAVKEAPAKDLYEEFYTDRYRISSSLHGAPEAYDIRSGKLAAVLEPDSYLTYVTQAGEYIITEYISAAGERYGILLNEKLEKLAKLPRLCDVRGDMLVFDYESGNLRQCPLYSLEELMALGERYLEEAK